jgi:hypothetical protein
MQSQQKQDNQKSLTLNERFAAMAPPKLARSSKPSMARMHNELLQLAVNLTVEGFIASDPNLAAVLKHLNGERSRHMALPQTIDVDKFAASVARIIGDDRRSARTLERLVEHAVCERLAAQCAVPLEDIAARSRFMTGSETRCKHGSKPPKGHNCSDACRQLVDPVYHGRPHFVVTLRWRSH